MNVNAVEAVWFLINAVTLVLSVLAYFAARGDREAVKALNGRARELAAAAQVRREGLRVIVQALLLSVVIPSLFVPGEAILNPQLVALMIVPVVLFASSWFDRRDRRALARTIALEANAAGITSNP